MFTVIPYRWHVNQPKHDGHDQPWVSKGTQVFAIMEPRGHLFSYAYLDKESAEHVAGKLASRPTNIEANFRPQPSIVTNYTYIPRPRKAESKV